MAIGNDATLFRYTTAGTLDSTFGTAGVVTQDFGGSDSWVGIGHTWDGKIIVSGYGGGDFAAARYHSGVGLNQRLYVQQDANYNVTSVSNAAGAVVERYRTTPYGQRTVLNDDFTADGDNTSDYAFDAGHQGLKHDAETRLMYNRARMLHPTLGRFTSRDPLGYVDGMSVYQAYRSNPLNWVDPLGHQSIFSPAAPDTSMPRKPGHYDPKADKRITEAVIKVGEAVLDAQETTAENQVAGAQPEWQDAHNAMLAAQRVVEMLEQELADSNEWGVPPEGYESQEEWERATAAAARDVAKRQARLRSILDEARERAEHLRSRLREKQVALDEARKKLEELQQQKEDVIRGKRIMQILDITRKSTDNAIRNGPIGQIMLP